MTLYTAASAPSLVVISGGRNGLAVMPSVIDLLLPQNHKLAEAVSHSRTDEDAGPKVRLGGATGPREECRRPVDRPRAPAMFPVSLRHHGCHRERGGGVAGGKTAP